MNGPRKLLLEFEYGNSSLLTREELIELVEYLMNSLKKMSSDCHKALAVVEGVPCKEYIITEGVNGKQLKLIYDVTEDFIKNELEKYDFHALKKEEME